LGTDNDLRRLALALEGTSEVFKVARIYATLAADGKSANFKFTPDQQEFRCMMAPEAFTPVRGSWGYQGWTTAKLSALSLTELKDALEMAWRNAQSNKLHRRR
jgi:hypothetical protein